MKQEYLDAVNKLENEYDAFYIENNEKCAGARFQLPFGREMNVSVCPPGNALAPL